jgi:hypothetical protein
VLSSVAAAIRMKRLFMTGSFTRNAG